MEEKRNFNHYGFLDYKKPSANQNDYRSTAYLAHVNLKDTHVSGKNRINTGECKVYQRAVPYQSNWESEQRACYTTKPFDPSLKRNPTMSCASTKFMKPYDESHFRFVPRPLHLNTTYKQDFLWQTPNYMEGPPIMTLPSAVKNQPITIDKARPGFSKYLDTKATSSGLSFVDYLKTQTEGIGAADQITFWNWGQTCGTSLDNIEGFAENMCQKTQSKMCPKRRNEFQNEVKHVPNSGLTTEVRDNFKLPRETVLFDTSHAYCPSMSTEIPEFAKSTESKMYGSGDRVQKYLDIGSTK